MLILVALCITLFCQSTATQNTSCNINVVKEKNMFGTDGIRRTVGHHPFTTDALPQLGSAIARWAIKKYGTNPTILIGHDTRLSCDFVKSGLKLGLLQHGVMVYDAGVLSTPAVCLLTKHNTLFDCGIVISASHNIYTDNGVKIIDGNNIKLTLEDELLISHLFHSDPEHSIDYDNLGKQVYWEQAEQEYIEHVIKCFTHNFLQGHTIVLDCAHGASYRLAPRIFKRCGARTITLHKHPNGENINKACGSQHPEQLQKAVLEHKATAGFAFDGDADRVIAVNSEGEVRDGDDILALLLNHHLYQNQEYIVGTIMTNEGFNTYLQKKNKVLLRTPVGDKYVAQKLETINADLGGEQAGHIILRDYLKTGDGVMTALRVMEVLINSNNYTMNTFKHFPQLLINISITEKKDLTKEPIASIIRKYEKRLHKGRIVVRYSGTQDLLRILVESDDEHTTHTIAHSLANELKSILSNNKYITHDVAHHVASNL